MAATTELIETKLGQSLDPSEVARVNQLLSEAMLMIRSRIPDLDTRLADGRTDPEAVDKVQSDAVIRVLRNPEGVKTEAADGFSYTVSERVAGGYLRIFPDEWALLGIRAKVGVIRPAMRLE